LHFMVVLPTDSLKVTSPTDAHPPSLSHTHPGVALLAAASPIGGCNLKRHIDAVATLHGPKRERQLHFRYVATYPSLNSASTAAGTSWVLTALSDSLKHAGLASANSQIRI
jgi:hypothetical protein